MRNRYDGEIGRGRRKSNNSSSSRESSPDLPLPKRPFSPTGSDAGETSELSNLEPQLHPPQERPLIRQAVAFASDKQPQNIVTYEATPPTVLVGFLPGQQITIPPRPPRAAKEKAAPKRPKRTDAYSGQTNRFRIDTYDPTPSTEPPIAHGNGPYSSLYRGATVPLDRGPNVPAENSTPSGYPRGSTPSSNTPLSNASSATLVSSPSVSFAPARSQPPKPPRQPPPRAAAAAKPPPKGRPVPNQQQRYTDRENPHPPAPPAPPHQSNYYTRPPPQSQSTVTPHNHTLSPYYRHDYEKGVWDPAQGLSPSPPRDMQDSRRSSHSQSSGSSRHQNRDSSHHAQINDPSGPQRAKNPLRMVTLLIQDLRSGMTDHQLAEVKVPLRLADHEGNGFWADAQDISEQLQQGPSRIDGPAKVYTLRGKYRQFILRVTKNNDDEHFSANVAVQADRTLDLVVEMLTPPGAPPQPPKIPTELLGAQYDDYDQENSSDQMDVDVIRNPQQIRDARKRATSPSFDDYDGPDSPPPPKKPSRPKNSYEPSGRQNSQCRNPAGAYDSNFNKAPHSRGRRTVSRERAAYESRSAGPPIPLSPRPREADFMGMLKQKVQDFDPKGFGDYFRSNAGNSIPDMLSQYSFLKKIFSEFIGKKVGELADTVEERHLVKLMGIKDAASVDDCKETMHLFTLYGDESLPRHDPRIKEMIDRKVDAEHKVQTRRDFLQLLRTVDDIWNNRLTPGQSSRPPSEDSGGETLRESRATKGMFVD